MAASTSPLSISTRGVDGLARSAVSTSFRSGSVGVGFQRDLELRRGLDRVFLALGDHADEIADPHHRDQPGNIAHRGFIDRDQAGADEIAGIDAGIRRPHHAAMQHAGHAHVMHIDEFAGGLGRKIDARHRLPDDGVGIDGLYRHVLGKLKPDGVARDQLAIADAAVVAAADQAVLDRQVAYRQVRVSPRRAPAKNAAPAQRPCAAAPR